METIFIQIASYRDPQLIPTIEDCLMNAKYPQNLRFGICNQTDNIDELQQYANDRRFKILHIPYKLSRGACWARNQIQTMCYDGETYTLQIDSHHRFVKNWDEKLINMIQTLQSQRYSKPLVTSYMPNFNPDNDPAERVHQTWIMNFDRFTPEGVVFFLPSPAMSSDPIPARFFSAHFAFTVGIMCNEVPHDPEFYFHGEEISIAVRAYTHGYDLFHPNEVILWHEYTRHYRTKHWLDHEKWWKLNVSSLKRNRILLGMEKGNIDFGIYGLGTTRSLQEYESYAGIRFLDRTVQEYTLSNSYPPKKNESKWISEFKHILNVPKTIFTESDYEFWCVAFHDKDGNQLYREDVYKEEIQQLLNTTSPEVCITRKFNTTILPYDWVVWPYSETNGWTSSYRQILKY